MADEIEKQDTQETVEPDTEEQVVAQNEEDENGVPSALTKILNKLRGKKETSEDSEESKDTESEDSAEKESDSDFEKNQNTEDSEESEEKEAEKTSESEDEKEEIDSRLVAAGRRRGWSNEKIVSIAENAPGVLEDLADLMDTLDKENAPKQDVQVEENPKPQVTKIDKFELNEKAISELKEKYGNEAVEGMIDNLIRPLAGVLNDTTEQINSLRGTLKEKEETQTRDEQISVFENVNGVFDDMSEDFPELGKYSDITMKGELDKNSKAYQVRSQLYDVMMMFHNNGHSLSDSIDSAFRWYKGEGAEKAIQKKVVKDLASRKKKFSPKPSNKKLQKTYKTPEDEGVAIIDEAKKKAGIT